ncbi:CarD family transcriptional regulator [Bacillus rubiinfantis]|uniref:CarD family transcriptional regulator n=1 Tax=Bacillus rubiinfantis TaxID=1499680 RepID=UPI0005A5E9A8|nr:CarD family transcriptional regulator [Bacillus rubiinfantis]
MFTIGDLIIYSGHGICKVDDICNKTIAGTTRAYYVLHPIDNNHGLTISTPVENKKNVISKLINQDEAREIIDSFHSKGIDWIEKTQLRIQTYTNIIKSGNRIDIAKVANTLIRKKHEIELEGKKFYESDVKLLTSIETILFKELAISLNKPTAVIHDKIEEILLTTTRDYA